jgi:hypothetical protein
MRSSTPFSAALIRALLGYSSETPQCPIILPQPGHEITVRWPTLPLQMWGMICKQLIYKMMISFMH